MGMCGPEDPLFPPLLQFARVPFQAKESVHKTPFRENFEILGSTRLNLHPKFSSQAPKFRIIRSQALKFGNFQFKSPHFRGKYQFASPTLRKSGPNTPTWKKVECLPGVQWPCWTLLLGPDSVVFVHLDRSAKHSLLVRIFWTEMYA